MVALPNVHPHSVTEWSARCAACPVNRPVGFLEVTLDPDVVSRMEEEAGEGVVLTAEPGTPPPDGSVDMGTPITLEQLSSRVLELQNVTDQLVLYDLLDL